MAFELEMKLILYLEYILLPIYVVGIFANICTLGSIYKRWLNDKNNPKPLVPNARTARDVGLQPAFALIALIAVADILSIICGPIYQNNIFVYIQNNAKYNSFCNAVMVIFPLCTNYSSHLLVLVTVDRAYAVLKNYGVSATITCVCNSINSKFFLAKIVAFFLGLVECFYHVINFILSEKMGCMLNPAPNQTNLVQNLTENFQLYNYLDAFSYAIIPAIVIIIANTMIVIEIKKLMARHQAQMNKSGTNKIYHRCTTVRRSKNGKVTKFLVVISLAFVVLTMPITIFSFFNEIQKNERLLVWFFQNMGYMNCCLNGFFYLYYYKSVTCKWRTLWSCCSAQESGLQDTPQFRMRSFNNQNMACTDCGLRGNSPSPRMLASR